MCHARYGDHHPCVISVTVEKYLLLLVGAIQHCRALHAQNSCTTLGDPVTFCSTPEQSSNHSDIWKIQLSLSLWPSNRTILRKPYVWSPNQGSFDVANPAPILSASNGIQCPCYKRSRIVAGRQITLVPNSSQLYS